MYAAIFSAATRNWICCAERVVDLIARGKPPPPQDGGSEMSGSQDRAGVVRPRLVTTRFDARLFADQGRNIGCISPVVRGSTLRYSMIGWPAIQQPILFVGSMEPPLNVLL